MTSAMPTDKESHNKKVTKLRRKASKLRCQLRDLNISHTGLKFEECVLRAWCESLKHVRSQAEQQQPAEALNDSSIERLELLQQEEAKLLQQLSAVEPLAAAAAAAAAPLLQAHDMDTIAPPGDPMALVREMFSRPPIPAAASMTVLDNAMAYRQIVLDLSINVQLLDGPQHAEALAAVKASLLHFWHLLVSLVLLGRQEVIEALKLMNYDTLQPMEPPHDDATVTQLLTALCLSDAQLEAISLGFSLAQRLSEPVMEEWQQLQQEVGKGTSSTGTSAAGSSSSSEERSSTAEPSAEGSDPPGTTDMPRGVNTRRVMLDAEQQRLARLQLVMQKKYILLFAHGAWFFGCMTWRQAARMYLLLWPFGPCLMRLALAVQQMWEAKQKQ